MLRPSYAELLEKLNEGVDKEDQIVSRYTIVMAAAKRARQLVDHAEPLVSDCDSEKPVSIAIKELYEGKIKVRQNFDA